MNLQNVGSWLSLFCLIDMVRQGLMTFKNITKDARCGSIRGLHTKVSKTIVKGWVKIEFSVKGVFKNRVG